MEKQGSGSAISHEMPGPPFDVVQTEAVYVDCFAGGRDHNPLSTQDLILTAIRGVSNGLLQFVGCISYRTNNFH
jgi:hypothetical protein